MRMEEARDSLFSRFRREGMVGIVASVFEENGRVVAAVAGELWRAQRHLSANGETPQEAHDKLVRHFEATRPG